jgi:hypothetical protein
MENKQRTLIKTNKAKLRTKRGAVKKPQPLVEKLDVEALNEIVKQFNKKNSDAEVTETSVIKKSEPTKSEQSFTITDMAELLNGIGNAKKLKYADDFIKHTPTEKINYRDTLLYPEHSHGAQVPYMWSIPTIGLHRHLSIAVQTNVLGCACIQFDPAYLHDNSTPNSTLVYVDDPVYNGTNAPAGGAVLATNYSLPVGNVGGSRLVSSSIHIIPQNSALTASGKITTALLKNVVYQPLVVGPIIAGLNTGDIANCKHFAVSSVSQFEAARICWLPFDQDNFEITPLNQALDSSAHPTFIFAAIIQGAAPNSNFTIELYSNFEVTSISQSVLLGMEKSCTSTEKPQEVINQLAIEEVNMASAYKSSKDYMYKPGRKNPLRGISTGVANTGGTYP